MGCAGADETSADGGVAATKKAQRKDPIYFYHLDRLGTPVAMSDEAGDTIWRAEYRPFGDLEKLETDPDGDGQAVENNLRFPGQFDDGVAGFLVEQGPYYNWHRYYDPSIGRYLQPEPLLATDPKTWLNPERGVPNPYAYAYNNPVWYVDPDGNQVAEGAAGGGAVAGPVGAGAGAAIGAGIAAAACLATPACREAVKDALDKCSKVRCKVAYHGPHHSFPGVGKSCHLQVTCWVKGSSGSGKNLRIPIPCLKGEKDEPEEP